jgi:6-pyruvoyltetrahydropterin/6-carboxytetrahydropterin synthase
MTRLSTIELFKEEMKFSAGHFTIFSSTVRENLHGHNYNVYAAFTTSIEDEGLSFDYRFYKDKLYKLCQSLDETVLLPGKCKHLSITEDGPYYHVKFHTETIIFLKRDAIILPINNVTVEELSHWLLQHIISDKEELDANKIVDARIKVYSGPGQSGSSVWEKSFSAIGASHV